VGRQEGQQLHTLVTSGQMERWRLRHQRKYHGSYESIHERNTASWTHGDDSWTPQLFHMFRFDPTDKVLFDVGAGGGWYALECLRAGARKVYCLEIDDRIIRQAKRSFQALGVSEEAYQFVNIATEGVAALPQADIIYCLTVFQHIPYRLAEGYFRWMAERLTPEGEAHLQFHQREELTTFLDSRERIANANLETALRRAGLRVTQPPRLVAGENIKPVWYIYVCARGEVPTDDD